MFQIALLLRETQKSVPKSAKMAQSCAEAATQEELLEARDSRL